MQNSNTIKMLLKHYGNIIINVNMTKRVIYSATDGNESLCENDQYDTFSRKLINKLAINENYVDTINRLLYDLKSLNANSSVPFDFVKTNGSPVTYSFTKIPVSDDEAFVLVKRELESKTEKLDELTKCYSKKFIIKKIKDAIKHKSEFSLLLLDIDNFKNFNDTYGHMFGDLVLTDVSKAMIEFTNDLGYAARIGGDEFLIILYQKNDYDKIYASCKGLRESINNICGNDIKKASVTTTIGCASYPLDGDEYEVLFQKADTALYRGKKKGRNCFIIYNEEKCKGFNTTKTESPEYFKKSFEKLYGENEEYYLIDNITDILSKDEPITYILEKVFDTVGNHFVLDRIVYLPVDFKTGNKQVDNVYIWNNKQSEKFPIYPTYEKIAEWRNALQQNTYVLSSISENIPFTEQLERDHVSALVASELIADNNIFGLVRYEMNSRKRTWTPSEISTLKLITRMIAIKLNSSEQIRELQYNYVYDSQMDIYNYVKWSSDVSNYIKNNPGLQFSVLEFEINNYKNFISVLGADGSKKFLSSIAEALKESVSSDLLYCRNSEDKFIIFFPHQKRQKINNLFITLISNIQEKQRTISLIGGVALSKEDESLQDVLDKASIARRRSNGKYITYFTDEISKEEQEKFMLESHMHEAIKNDEFLLYLQPKINSNNGEIVGAEALSRWNYKHEKMIFPNSFIPLFESNGFIIEFDFAVFRNVCRFQRRALDEGKKTVPISINTSRFVIDYSSYLRTLESIRKEYNVDPRLLEIEITERMYSENENEISKFIENLHKCGYKTSIDDFGSGYSNFSTLSNLDFDIVKLDKSFVDNIDNDKEKLIISSIINLVRRLNMELLCEGVETQDVADYLRTIGCNIIQGYLYDKPLPEDVFKDKYIK